MRLHKAEPCQICQIIHLMHQPRPFCGAVGRQLPAPITSSTCSMRILAPVDDPNSANALRHLQEITSFFRVLGSYPCQRCFGGPGDGEKSKRYGIYTQHQPWGLGCDFFIRSLHYSREPTAPTRRHTWFGNFGQFLAKNWFMNTMYLHTRGLTILLQHDNRRRLHVVWHHGITSRRCPSGLSDRRCIHPQF